jgi:hypothetical protein
MTHPMAITAAQAVRLLAELLEIDRAVRTRRQPLQLVQKQRRAAVVRDLHLFALSKQRGSAPTGAEQRQHPRANVRLKVQLLGGPHKVDLQSDSLAVGGASVTVKFTPRVGDLVPLRLVPLEDAPFEVMGEVVWFDPVRSRAGVRFQSLTDEARAVLERLIFSDLVRAE